jgi:hypothetical protein
MMIIDHNMPITFLNIFIFMLLFINIIFAYILDSIAQNTSLISGLIDKVSASNSVYTESINLLFKENGIDKEL